MLKLFSETLAAALLITASTTSLPAQTFTVLANFNGMNGEPFNKYGSAIIQGPDGNFYGTTGSGSPGDIATGSVFKMTPNGTLTTLYSFTGQGDGGDPQSGVIVGSDGNLYGSSFSAIFKLTLGGTFTLLNNSSQLVYNNGIDQASDGNFYGTTSNEFGSIFYRMTLAGDLTVLHTFTSGPTLPLAPLIQGTDGNLYGTSSSGGISGGEGDDATVFKITTGGSITVLATLLPSSLPVAPLLQANDGNFYGIATDHNIVFKMTPAGTLTTLYTFARWNCVQTAIHRRAG
jgi:uncharacterized repeat protein (TIGR03803 family)